MTDNTRALDAAITSAIEDRSIVGTDVVVMHEGEVVFHRTAGVADREADTPVIETTRFRLDSVTKAFTSIAAHILMAQRKLHPNDAVTTWLPEYQPRLPGGELADLRLHHLLTHTSGLSFRASEGEPGPYTRAGVSDGADLAGISMEENLRRLSTVPLAFEPGTAWEYSLSTDLLGEIVGRAYGSSLRDAIRDLITIPLGLESISFDLERSDASLLSAQYVNGDTAPTRMPEEDAPPPGQQGPIRSLRRVFDPNAYAAGGNGLIGTAIDVATFLDAVRVHDPRLIDSHEAGRLFENQIGLLESDAGWGYTFGWSILVDPAREPTPQSVGTISWAGGLGNRWFVDPSKDLTVVSLSNTSYAGAFGPFPDSIRDAAYDLISG